MKRLIIKLNKTSLFAKKGWKTKFDENIYDESVEDRLKNFKNKKVQNALMTSNRIELENKRIKELKDKNIDDFKGAVLAIESYMNNESYNEDSKDFLIR